MRYTENVTKLWTSEPYICRLLIKTERLTNFFLPIGLMNIIANFELIIMLFVLTERHSTTEKSVKETQTKCHSIENDHQSSTDEEEFYDAPSTLSSELVSTCIFVGNCTMILFILKWFNEPKR